MNSKDILATKVVEKETEKSRYLKKFQRENMSLDFFGKPKLDEVGLKILDLLKKRRLNLRTSVCKPSIRLQLNQI